MALLGSESWDIWEDDEAQITDYWQDAGNNPSILLGEGRCGSNCYRSNTISGTGPSIGVTAGDQTGYCGFAFKPTSVPTTPLLLIDGPTYSPQMLVFSLANGAIRMYTGPNTVLGTIRATSAAGLITGDHWYHFGCQWKVDSTTGYFKAWVNGVLVIDYTGRTTSSTAFSGTGVEQWSILTFGGATTRLDDMYWGDTTGSAPWNAFLGDLRVEGQLALTDADGGGGTYQDFTPSTGSDHGALVDETPPDDDTTYLQSATVGHTETFVFPSITLAAGTVYGIQLMPNVKKSDSGGRTVGCAILQGGVLTVGTAQGMSQTDYNYVEQMFQTNPTTSGAWDATTADNMEGGIQVTA